jgi:hypothetical protein
MTEEREQRSSHGGFGWIALAVLLIYVLSIGPVAAIAQRSGSGRTAVRHFYAPIIWLHNNTPLQKPLEAYLGLWGVK